MQTQSAPQLSALSSALQTSKAMSSKYVTLDTEVLVNYLLALTTSNGEQVFQLREINNSRSKNAGRGKHSVRLRTTRSYELNGETLYPELFIINSYDGSCPLRVEMGIFRLICTNGMVVKSRDLGEIKIRHIGTPQEAAFDMVRGFAANLPKFVSVQQQLVETTITDEDALDFAKEAAQIRWMKPITDDDALELLTATRPEDEGNSVWVKYNILQEKFLQGGVKLSNHRKMSRTISNVGEDLRINTELFELALRYATPAEEMEFEMVV